MRERVGRERDAPQIRHRHAADDRQAQVEDGHSVRPDECAARRVQLGVGDEPPVGDGQAAFDGDARGRVLDAEAVFEGEACGGGRGVGERVREMGRRRGGAICVGRDEGADRQGKGREARGEGGRARTQQTQEGGTGVRHKRATALPFE